MSEVIEQSETGEAEKSSSRVAQVAGKAALAGMSMMGSSVAHTEPHVDHGYAPARWAAVAISAFGWLIGGIAYPFGVWWLVGVGGALQIVAIIVNLALNGAGLGAKSNRDWAAAKAEAKAARAAAKAA